MGLGEHCEGDMFNPVKVRDQVKSVACGESHTMIITLKDNQVQICGSNDKLQLGNPKLPKDHVQPTFQPFEGLAGV